MARMDPQVNLRLPDALLRRVKSHADANRRSVNAEIVHTLAEAYPAPVEPESVNEALKDAALEVLDGWEAVLRATGQDPSENEALERLKLKIQEAVK